jgi:plastocyanin
MTQLKNLAVLLLALAALAGLAACGSSDGDSAGTSGDLTSGEKAGEASGATIVVKNGEPVGGVQELEYSAGDQVRFTVDSDVTDEIHVHGYDLMKEVPAGGSVSFSFPAEIEGIFEVELEGLKEQIAELRVNP